MDVTARMELIRELCSFEGRLAGTDAERRAGNWLAKRLRAAGRGAEVEPTYVHPQWALIYAAHCALGFAGSLVALSLPALGFALVLAAATSMYLDLNARLYLLRNLFFRRASQNVVSPGRRPEAPARVLLCAHYDAAKSGAAYRRTNVRRFSRLAAALPFTFSYSRLVFWSLAFLLLPLGARLAELDSGVVPLLQSPPTLVLLVAIFALVDIELSDVVPAANKNASGVATALALADVLDREPPEHLDVWVVLTGASECLMEGMRSFVRSHRRELEREMTYFLCLDSVGAGALRYVTGEGLAVTFEHDRRLVELCEAIAEADQAEANRFGAERLAHGFATDALPPRLARYPAVALTCLEPGSLLPANYRSAGDVPDALDPRALERSHDFALALVRQLDRDVGRRFGRSDRT